MLQIVGFIHTHYSQVLASWVPRATTPRTAFSSVYSLGHPSPPAPASSCEGGDAWLRRRQIRVSSPRRLFFVPNI